MARHPFRYPSVPRGSCHGALQRGFVQMVPANLTTRGVAVLSRRRKDPLPRPVAHRAQQLPAQVLRQSHIPAPTPNVLLIKVSYWLGLS